jgi:hypothetical protein
MVRSTRRASSLHKLSNDVILQSKVSGVFDALEFNSASLVSFRNGSTKVLQRKTKLTARQKLRLYHLCHAAFIR